MPKYHITYYYNATGTGGAQEKDYGIVTAPNADLAIDAVVDQQDVDNEEWKRFFRGCLCAAEVDAK